MRRSCWFPCFGQQFKIGEKREELQELQAQLARPGRPQRGDPQLLENSSGLEEYAERKARTELDYAKPGERVFVDVG